MSISEFLLVGSFLLFVSILASKTSVRIGIPSLILFVGVGMLAGSDGLLKISFDNANAVQFIGLVALNFILFSGGMDTKKSDIIPILKPGILLSVFGTMITAISVGLFVNYISDKFTILEGLLIGAIVSSTDAAAIFSIFRMKHSSVRHKLRPILEFESGSNDPMAYFLTISFIYLIQHPAESFTAMIPIFIKGMVIGGIVGVLMGKIIVFIIRKINLSIDGLYPVLVIALTFFTNAFTDVIQGNGILAIYVAGLVVGNSTFVRKNNIMQFYSAFTWLMQIVMFITLGLLVYPSRIPDIATMGIMISLFLIFIARPLAVFLTTATTTMTIKDRLFISWGGLRGASPIIFATFPMVAGIQYSGMIFHIVFFVSLMSVFLQGSTLIWVADKLKLLVNDKHIKHVSLELSSGTSSLAQEVIIGADSHVVGLTISEVDIPEHILFVLIERDGDNFIPKGSTVIEKGDMILVLSDEETKITKFAEYLDS